MATKKKAMCKFGAACYRKNPQHRKEFRHSESAEDSEEEYIEESVSKRTKVQDEDDDDSVEVVSPSPKKKNRIDDFFLKKNTTKKEKIPSDVNNSPASVSNYVRKKESQTQSEVSTEAVELQDDGPPSPTDDKENIKSKFLMDMPEDFYDLWDFAKTLYAQKPEDAFKRSLGLQLVGPFDVLAGKCRRRKLAGKKPCYLRHWRYYYDPPEFMTVVRGDDKTQFHMGYFRDDPKDMPVFVASNAAKENCVISPRGENLFAALSWFIEDLIKKDTSRKSELSSLKAKLVEFADTCNYPLEQKTKRMKERDKKMNCKTFHGAGMVVPVDDNDVGYREVPETPADLKKMLKKITDSKDDEARNKNFDPLMELIMLVQFANDECDYGEGLELGLDLFSFGGDVFKRTILNLLPLAYELLGRLQYKEIITAHLEDRRHTANLSQLD